MSVQALRDFINRYNAAATGIAALGAALDAKASGAPLEGALGNRIHELLGVLGAGDMLADMSADEVKPFLAEIRAMAALDTKLLHAQTRTVGWNHTEPAILQGTGETSAGFVQPLARAVVPSLEGLAERLAAPTATFLDVGVGVGGLAIAAARMWPALRVVGIDPWTPSLALARENVAKAGLVDRISLREQGVEDLPDDRSFDLAWIPTMFLPEKVIRPACDRVHRALRPGGWVLFNAVVPGSDAQSGALWRLRMAMFGDSCPSTSAAEGLLREAGFAEVRVRCPALPAPSSAW